MNEKLDNLDLAFDSLKSQRAVLSDDFSLNLEERLMKASEVRKSKRTVWLALAAGAFCLLMTGAGAGYAATDGFTSWPWSIFIQEDGTVTNSDGETIGGMVENEDGSFTATVETGEGNISIHTGRTKIEMGPEGELVETPLTADDLKGQELRFEVAP